MRSDNTHLLFVNPFHREEGLFVDLDLDPFWNGIEDRVRKSQGEFEGIALEICPEAHPDNLKPFLKSLGDPHDHICDETPCQTLKGSGSALVIGALDENFSPIHGNRDSLRQRVSEKPHSSARKAIPMRSIKYSK